MSVSQSGFDKFLIKFMLLPGFLRIAIMLMLIAGGYYIYKKLKGDW